mgnify:CR=1 FL=1
MEKLYDNCQKITFLLVLFLPVVKKNSGSGGRRVADMNFVAFG